MENTFTPGQKVRSIYGEKLTVLRQVGVTVWFYETREMYHITKVYA
jgi:hypothetical protein